MSTETPAQPRREYRGGNPALALILILLGVAFLLNNFGILGWNVWADLWRFWPVALILFGVQTIFGRTRLGSFMIFLVGLLFIGLIVIYSYLLPGSGYLTNNRTSITYTPPSSSPTYASQRIVKLHAGVGKVTIDDDYTAGLYKLDAINAPESAKPTISESNSGSQITITVEAQPKNWLFLGPTPEYIMSLGRQDLRTDLNLETGVGQSTVKLDQVPLRKLDMQIGTGSASVELGRSSLPQESSRFDIGTGSLHLKIPAGTGLKVEYDLGIGSLKVGEVSLKGDGTYATPNYDSSYMKVHLKIEVGTGSAEIAW